MSVSAAVGRSKSRAKTRRQPSKGSSSTPDVGRTSHPRAAPADPAAVPVVAECIYSTPARTQWSARSSDRDDAGTPFGKSPALYMMNPVYGCLWSFLVAAFSATVLGRRLLASSAPCVPGRGVTHSVYLANRVPTEKADDFVSQLKYGLPRQISEAACRELRAIAPWSFGARCSAA